VTADERTESADRRVRHGRFEVGRVHGRRVPRPLI
jgi:hypothetical protein